MKSLRYISLAFVLILTVLMFSGCKSLFRKNTAPGQIKKLSVSESFAPAVPGQAR
jgi:hypothetical protein